MVLELEDINKMIEELEKKKLEIDMELKAFFKIRKLMEKESEKSQPQ